MTEFQQRLLRLAALGRTHRYPRCTQLLSEGEGGTQIFIVLSGRLRVYTANDQGRQLTLALLDPVDMVGEMSLDGGVRSANVETTETSLCVSIDRDTLQRFMGQEPEFAMDLLCRVIARARLATQQASNLALLDAYHRLTQWLQQHAVVDAHTGECCISKLASQTELAQQLGCSREMVSRLMKDLLRGDYLQMRGRRLILSKPLPQRW